MRCGIGRFMLATSTVCAVKYASLFQVQVIVHKQHQRPGKRDTSVLRWFLFHSTHSPLFNYTHPSK
jgi:hypothetical protein